VVGDRLGAQAEPLGDLVVVVASRQQARDLAFAVGQLLPEGGRAGQVTVEGRLVPNVVEGLRTRDHRSRLPALGRSAAWPWSAATRPSSPAQGGRQPARRQGYAVER
jgi:hypothetical protein